MALLGEEHGCAEAFLHGGRHLSAHSVQWAVPPKAGAGGVVQGKRRRSWSLELGSVGLCKVYRSGGAGGRGDVTLSLRETPLGRGERTGLVSSGKMSLGGKEKLEWYSPPLPGRYHWAEEGRSRCGTVLSLEICLGRGGES